LPIGRFLDVFAALPWRTAVKYLVLVGDGMADYPIAELGGKTPIEAANTPAMDRLAATGIVGLFCPIPDGLPPGSDIGNLSLFGYNPRTTFTGRAPLEAANQGIPIADNQVVFRCNLVTLENGRMRDFTADHISSEEGAQLIAALNEAFADEPVVFHPGVSYRHLAVVSSRNPVHKRQLAGLTCEPPHNITDQEYRPYFPQGTDAAVELRDWMERSQLTLRGHEVSEARQQAGKLPATSVWLWGQGVAPDMRSYAELYGKTGAVVSAVDLVNGIGRCAGFEVVPVEGATGYLDTNYGGKVAAALAALARVDVVYLHVEAPDETSHQGRLDLKLQAIEDFDAQVVAPCAQALAAREDVRLLVAPDHITALSTKTHAGGPVPFVIEGAGIAASGAPGYSERSAAASGVLVAEGYQLVQRWLAPAPITGQALAFEAATVK
jgi:2,3-bisphosphoglycerate-independent phosphoglycerate mutase